MAFRWILVAMLTGTFFGSFMSLRAQVSPAAIPALDLKTNGAVTAILSQPDGKIVIGGDFTIVNGVPRQYLARLNANGSTDLAWDVPLDQPAAALALAGDQLFVSGSFTSIGGLNRSGLAKVSSVTGQVDLSWKPDIRVSGLPAGDQGFALALAVDAQFLYLGGAFTSVNGSPRSGLARVQISGAGQLDAQWNPAPAGGRLLSGVVTNVYRLLLLDGMLYAAGTFTQIGGQARVCLARLATSGSGAADTGWNPSVQGEDPEVSVILPFEGQLIVGGIFSGIGGATRKSLGKVSLSDASSDPQWDPIGESILGRLAYDGGALLGRQVLLAGSFRTLGGLYRPRLAVLAADGVGAVDETWQALPNGRIAAITPSPGGILVGGAFQLVGDSTSLGIARLDSLTGRRDETYPAQTQKDGRVFSFVRQPDGRTILGGDFWLVNGLPRRNLIRVDGQGQLDSTWLPNPDRPVQALALSGSVLFAGGYFSQIGGLPRARLAKLSTLDGPLVDPDWQPGADSGVLALATNGAELFVGGEFTHLGGLPRQALGKVSVFGAGAVDPTWDPYPDGPSGFFGGIKPRVYALVPALPDLFVAGQFQTIGGRSRHNLARIRSDGTGAADAAWISDLTLDLPFLGDFAAAFALAYDGTFLYAGGYFDFEADGIEQRHIAKIAASDGTVDSDWLAFPDGAIGSIAVRGNRVVFGGAVPIDYGVLLADDDDATQGKLFFGTFGGFGGANGEDRANLAEVFADTGELTSFNPSPNSGVFSLQTMGEDLLVGGAFSAIGGEARGGLAFLPVANAPGITQDPTNISGVVLGRNPTDGPEVTHFRITQISGGTLLKKTDAITPVVAGDFITVEEGSFGLIFNATGLGTPGISAASSLNATPAGVGSAVTTVNVVLDRVLPVVRLGSSQYSVKESDNVVLIEITKPAGVAATATLTTSDGSARDGADYSGTSGTTVTLSPNETSRMVPIAITRDNVPESDENFTVRLTASGGATVAAPGTALVSILDSDTVGDVGSLTNTALPSPAAPPADGGALHVTLTPPEAHGQWRLTGEVSWRDAGSVVHGLSARPYLVEFRPVPGFSAPAPAVVSIGANGTRELAVAYTLLAAQATGTLSVTIAPPAVATSPDTALRGHWRRTGETAWRETGETLEVPAGAVPIEFQPVDGFDTPAPRDVLVGAGQLNSATGLYVVGGSVLAAGAVPVAFEQMAQEPYCYNGQLQSDLGEASGFVVQKHVVLTAAHVVFDDAALSYVAAVRWRHQRYRDRYEPVPEVSRGFLVFDGYAGARRAAPTPGEGTPSSNQQDVAAVYFRTFAARGGFGGYLVSQQAESEWLLSTRFKSLVGYPTGGFASAATDGGKLHATVPRAVEFARLLDSVYATNQITGYPGGSGGPLYVQADGGSYFPAAIYLGGTAQTIVRAIDSTVASLINRAETAGNGGDNNTNGGVVNVSQGFTTTAFSSGQIKCALLPDALRSQTGWRVQGARTSAYQKSGDAMPIPEGDYIIEYRAVPGYITPPPRRVTINANQVSSIAETYRPPVTITASASPASGGTAVGGVFGQGLIAVSFARPALGYHFGFWQENGAVVSTAGRYSFPATANRTLVAVFVPGPFVNVAGMYRGFATSSVGSVPGLLQLKVSPAGMVTARFAYNGRLYALKAPLTQEGLLHRAFEPGMGLALDLTVDLLDLSGEITGQITVAGSPSAALTASRDGFTAKSPTMLDGRYTMLLPPIAPVAGTPGGVGYGTLLVKPSGALTFVGKLGDGEAVSVGSGLVHGVEWKFAVAPYRSAGTVAGTITFQPVGVLGGSLQWIKPPKAKDSFYPLGITATIDAKGLRYTAPSAKTRVLGFDRGVLNIAPMGLTTAPAPQAFILTQRNAFVFPVRGFSLRLVRATGLFTGSYLDGRKSRFIGGAILRGVDDVRGIIIGTGATDAVSVTTAP